MSPGHFAPAAQRTPQFRLTSRLPQLSLRRPRFRELLLRRPPGAAPDLSIGTTEVLVSAQDFVPGPKISALAGIAVVFALPLLASPGLPGWLPTWGPPAGRWDSDDRPPRRLCLG
jgi:hypothetical protein